MFDDTGNIMYYMLSYDPVYQLEHDILYPFFSYVQYMFFI